MLHIKNKLDDIVPIIAELVINNHKLDQECEKYKKIAKTRYYDCLVSNVILILIIVIMIHGIMIYNNICRYIPGNGMYEHSILCKF